MPDNMSLSLWEADLAITREEYEEARRDDEPFVDLPAKRRRKHITQVSDVRVTGEKL